MRTRDLFLACVLVGCVFGLNESLVSRQLLMDERPYVLAAVTANERGALALVDGWFYPAPLAHIFAAILHVCGEWGLVVSLRTLNFVGMSLVWLLTAQIVLGRQLQHLAVLFVPVLAWVSDPYWCLMAGNVSGIIAIFLFVAIQPTRGALSSSVFLSMSALFKPYAFGLVLRERGASFWALTLVIVLMSALTKVVGTSDDFLLQVERSPTLARGMVELHAPWQAAPLIAIAIGGAIVRRDGAFLKSQGLVVSWLALPVVWPHTTAVLTLVPLAVAFRRAWERKEDDTRLPRVLGVVLLGTILVQANTFALSAYLAFFPSMAGVALLCLLRPKEEIRKKTG